jgi:hypothetical protein
MLMIQRMLGYEDSLQEINPVGPRDKILCECWVELSSVAMIQACQRQSLSHMARACGGVRHADNTVDAWVLR